MSQASMVSPVEEVVEFFARGPSREEIAAFRLSGIAQERLRELLQRNASGVATPEEDCELDQMVLLDDIVSLIRARVQLMRQGRYAAPR
jgi:uncharacterized protein with von Willebrand factor type A (vWA) domain